MSRWKIISIYIPDGNPRSIKICDIKTSIAKAIFIPRNRIIEWLTERDLEFPWIYFLIWEEDELGKNNIYIWEADPLKNRISEHNKKREDWNYVIAFVSEKNNINKGHIKFLENYCYEEAKRADKCILNQNVPTKSTITEQEQDFILDFFDDIKILISTLWYPIFEIENKKKKKFLYCEWKLAKAKWEYTEDGLMVYQDSTCNIEESNTCPQNIRKLREYLLEENFLKKSSNLYVFKRSYLFSSLSTSASVILWRSANWWTEWKDANWNTADKIFRKN